MVEPIFQAPTPPPMEPQQNPQVGQQQNGVQQSSEMNSQTENVSAEPVTVETPQPQSQKEQVLQRLNELKENFLRYFWYSVGGLFLLGMFFGCAMSGGDSSPKAQAPSGLTRIIRNSYIKGRLPICGAVRLSEPCVFYVLNHSIIDQVSESYFTQVANAMQRPENSIKTENVLYAKELIPPGYFAEIIVPVKR